jgi:hypothetical protein
VGDLKASGIDPAPQRTGLTWPQFLRSQAEAILACDFFTVDLLDGTQAYVLVTWNHAAGRSGLDPNGRVIDLEPAAPDGGHTGGFHLPRSSSLLLEG